MGNKIIGRSKDDNGRTRFFVYPIESERGFKELVGFVSKEYGVVFGELHECPGVIYQKGIVDKMEIGFGLCDDGIGVEIFACDESNVWLIEKIALGIEERIREVWKQQERKA